MKKHIPVEPTIEMSAAGMRVIKGIQADHFHKYAGGIANSVFEAMVNAAPSCPYCGATEGLRVKCDGYGNVPREYTCEDCFTSTDTGPCFDDLPEVRA